MNLGNSQRIIQLFKHIGLLYKNRATQPVALFKYELMYFTELLVFIRHNRVMGFRKTGLN
jgi:hypothetical protein